MYEPVSKSKARWLALAAVALNILFGIAVMGGLLLVFGGLIWLGTTFPILPGIVVGLIVVFAGLTLTLALVFGFQEAYSKIREVGWKGYWRHWRNS